MKREPEVSEQTPMHLHLFDAAVRNASLHGAIVQYHRIRGEK